GVCKDMKITKCFALILAVTVAAGGLVVFNASAAKAANGEGRSRGRLLERAKEKLGVSDDQAAQIKAILKADKDSITSLMSRMHEARAGLRGAIQSTDATEASVRAAAAK